MDVKNTRSLAVFRPEKMQKVNLFENARMFCDLYCLEPGQEQSVHEHAGNEKIYYVLDGEASVTIGPETRVVKPGEAVCAWAGEPHGIRNDSQGRVTCLVFMAPHPKPERFQ